MKTLVVLIFLIIAVNSYERNKGPLQKTLDMLRDVIRDRNYDIIFRFAMDPFYTHIYGLQGDTERTLLINERCIANHVTIYGPKLSGYCLFKQAQQSYKVEMRQDLKYSETGWKIFTFEKIIPRG